jgi:hypothetical protein
VIWKSGSTDKSCEEFCRLQFHRVLVLLQSGHKETLVISNNTYSEKLEKSTEIPNSSSEKSTQKKLLKRINFFKNYEAISAMYAYISSRSPRKTFQVTIYQFLKKPQGRILNSYCRVFRKRHEEITHKPKSCYM